MASRLEIFARLVAQLVAAGGVGEVDELLGLALVHLWPRRARRWWRRVLEPVMIGTE